MRYGQEAVHADRRRWGDATVRCQEGEGWNYDGVLLVFAPSFLTSAIILKMMTSHLQSVPMIHAYVMLNKKQVAEIIKK